jgi:hypothetical protein
MHRSRRGTSKQDQRQKTSRKGHRLWLLPRISFRHSRRRWNMPPSEPLRHSARLLSLWQQRPDPNTAMRTPTPNTVAISP